MGARLGDLSCPYGCTRHPMARLSANSLCKGVQGERQGRGQEHSTTLKSLCGKEPMISNPEQSRLGENQVGKTNWQRWGPYLSERAWGTVREDYSADGDAWNYFPHDHARSRAYRWNEDGMGGFCDDKQHLCLSVALWNAQDQILKERMFGLTNQQGNHGEDVKEYYFFLDSTPTHSYAKMLYKYPQVAYPYAELVQVNGQRTQAEPEFELFDALPDIFLANRYFDVFIEYAKADVEDILCRITTINRGPDPRRCMSCRASVVSQRLRTWRPYNRAPTMKAIGAPGAARHASARDQGRD